MTAGHKNRGSEQQRHPEPLPSNIVGHRREFISLFTSLPKIYYSIGVMSSVFLNFFRKIKLIDIAVFAVFAAVTTYALSFAYSSGVARRELVVHTPRGIFAYDMSKDRIIDIEGAIGISRIEISGDTARFLDSPCPNKTCVQSMPIRETGEWSACLPNQVFLRIEGGRAGAVDATVR